MKLNILWWIANTDTYEKCDYINLEIYNTPFFLI